ncbi:protelomerase family protein [Chondrinema litorale]|uniref:protelomerase family protein n=1 Tax=Chondrinema litorale TaxID=2994555 RepID=UPI002542B348|nr:protelomerase family protein [Chondrinema litorale]UZS00089.1 protelomerase family protein [Chondrinema litorale]
METDAKNIDLLANQIGVPAKLQDMIHLFVKRLREVEHDKSELVKLCREETKVVKNAWLNLNTQNRYFSIYNKILKELELSDLAKSIVFGHRDKDRQFPYFGLSNDEYQERKMVYGQKAIDRADKKVLKIESKEKHDALIERATELLSSTSYLEQISAIALLTGRRTIEIVKKGQFRAYNPFKGSNIKLKKMKYNQQFVYFKGQAKGGRAEEFPIPVLASPKLVLESIDRLRSERDFDSMTDKQINNNMANLTRVRAGKKDGAGRSIIDKAFGDFIELEEETTLSLHKLRDVYANICLHKYEQFSKLKGEQYIKYILGERNYLSVSVERHYNKTEIKDNTDFEKYIIELFETTKLRELTDGKKQLLLDIIEYISSKIKTFDIDKIVLYFYTHDKARGIYQELKETEINFKWKEVSFVNKMFEFIGSQVVK